MSIFFEILVRIAIYGSQIDQSHGDNRLTHMIIEARAQCVDRAWILYWRKMSTHVPRHKSRGRKKRFKYSYKTSVNLEDLDVDFVLKHFKLCLFVNEGDEETSRSLNFIVVHS